MGGYGSGRRSGGSRRDLVEDCWVIDLNFMVRDGLLDVKHRVKSSLHWWQRDSGKEVSSIGYELDLREQWIGLQYRRLPGGEPVDYRFALTTTYLPWGNKKRWWFICGLRCDGVTCGRRVGKLYLPPCASYFGCRHCYDLTYQSSRESLGSGAGRGMALGGMSDKTLRRIFTQRLLEDDRARHRVKVNKQRRRRRKAKNWS